MLYSYGIRSRESRDAKSVVETSYVDESGRNDPGPKGDVLLWMGLLTEHARVMFKD